MKLRKITKKMIAYVCVIALTISSLVGTYTPVSAAADLPDLILDGGEEGASSMIGTYTAPTSRNKPTDDYKYLGYVSFLDMIPDGELVADGNQYRYLVMTVTGDITQLRFEFNRLAEDESQELQGPYWFNSEGQDCYFVAVDSEGNPIDMPLVCDNTTIVIDLLQSVHPEVDNTKYYSDGVELDYFNTGIHMHCDEMVTHGNGEGITISNAYLTATLPVIEEEETTEAPTEEVTEAPTEEVTENPGEETTEAPIEETTEEVTEAPTELPDPLVLDDGTDGAFVGHTLSSDADGYAYGGYVYLKNATADYKYFVLTYTGSLANTRFEYDGTAYWFDSWQTNKLVDVNGDDIDTSYSDAERTVVIDLEKSDVELGWSNDMHIHTENLLTNGGVTFVNGYLTKTAPEIEEPLPDPLVLDDGTDGAFVGHTLSSDADGYTYGGYVYLKNATADYKYFVLTYTGSLANTRFEYDGTAYWFDSWQTNKLVDMNGDDIDTSYSDAERTVVIDLEKSDVELGWSNDMHIHTENLLTNGGVTFVNGYVTKSAPIYDVTVDGNKVAEVVAGQTYTLGDATYGYYSDGKAYKANTEITVTEDIALTSINNLSVNVAKGAAIRTSTPAGLRFQAAVVSDNEEAVKSDAVKEGMLITANDIFENNQSDLDLTSAYKVLNVENKGWFEESTMTYCGAVANISEANYTRDFIARAYVTVTYTDGTSVTVYSGMSDTRNVSWVASAVKAAGYPNFGATEISVIDSFIK